jgi:arginase
MSTNRVQIAIGGAEHVDDVRELWLALHHHHRDVATTVPLVDDDELSWRRRRQLYLDHLARESGFFALASVGEDLVGYAFVFIADGPDDTFLLGERYAEVYSLSVAASMRARGIGTQLLDFIDYELAGRGISDLKIAVMVGNEGARRLYERRGLREAETVLYRVGAHARRVVTTAGDRQGPVGPCRILHVETNLGLRPTGVERLGSVLLELGIAERLGAESVDRIVAAPFDHVRDPAFGARNVHAVAALASDQADRVGEILEAGRFPVVLGGDDSVLFGNLLALRRIGSSGLVLIDGHTDYWDLPDGTGELSDSDLWIATGHGPDVIADLEGRGPLVPPEACVVYGHRDRADQIQGQSQDVYREPMLVRSLAELRAAGIENAANHAAAFLAARQSKGVWLHFDADCLSDELMPAVDWRIQGGLEPDEAVALARPLVRSGLISGIDVTIYNPSLDTKDFRAGRTLLETIARILT